MKLLVLGAGGMLGSDLVGRLEEGVLPYAALSKAECDVTDARQCRDAVRSTGADVVINCAAYTDVNRAETERELCLRVNAEGAENVANACAEAGARCVYISTDYVFDGEAASPYAADAATNPLNVYGASKLEGELRTAAAPNHAIIRTSWLYGLNGRNFVTTMLALAGTGKPLKIVNDQFGSPTYTWDLARAVIDVAVRSDTGIFHATNSGYCSWFEFAQEIFRLAGISPAALEPVESSQFKTPARRPVNSRLSQDRIIELGIDPLPQWPDALRRYIEELKAARA